MVFQSVDDAYRSLGAYLQAFAGTRKWDIAKCEMQIFPDMAKGSQSLWLNGNEDNQGGFEADPKAIWSGLDAALFLRDHVLKNTGQRIWGLSFTLYPEGKFKLDYDYNKPDGYEETEQDISVEDAIKRLQDLGVDVKEKKSI